MKWVFWLFFQSYPLRGETWAAEKLGEETCEEAAAAAALRLPCFAEHKVVPPLPDTFVWQSPAGAQTPVDQAVKGCFAIFHHLGFLQLFLFSSVNLLSHTKIHYHMAWVPVSSAMR